MSLSEGQFWFSENCLHFSKCSVQWEGSNLKQSARWQHVSQLKASALCIWSNKLWWFKTQQLILGTGTAIWWVTEPHSSKWGYSRSVLFIGFILYFNLYLPWLLGHINTKHK